MTEKELLDELKKWVNHDDRVLELIRQYGQEQFNNGVGIGLLNIAD